MKTQKDKIAVITGGNSGIGLALAKKMLDENYQVIITSRSGKAELYHPKLSVVQIDVTDPAAMDKAKETIVGLAQKIDVLVNNAAIASDIELTVPTYQTFKDTIDVNLTGLVYFAELMLPLLNDDGHVLNITSQMGLLAHAMPDAPAYRISKAGLNMYTKLLALRYQNTTIKVTAVHPGWVRTKLGGEQAPLDPRWSANGIFELITNTARSGEFRNIQSGDNFLL